MHSENDKREPTASAGTSYNYPVKIPMCYSDTDPQIFNMKTKLGEDPTPVGCLTVFTDLLVSE